jgi:hypothetical protein
LVTNAFFPEISPRSYRATELAKEFCRQGHEVIVISKFRDHNYSEFLAECPINLKMWARSKFPEIPQPQNGIMSVINRLTSRILSVLFEYPGIEDMFRVRKNLRIEEGYDLMISFAVPYPVHWGVAWSRRRNHRIAEVWVADCGDPYMGDILDTFRKSFYFGYMEKWFCRKADYISIPIETAKSAYYKEFHEKIKIIPQGFNFEIPKNKSVMNDMPTFAYAGSFIPGARDPEQLMKYLFCLDIPFRFFVFTNQSELLNEFREKLKGKLIISDYIARGELMKLMNTMDFLVNFDNNTNLNSPSKLIDYAITGRPVLNIEKVFKSEYLLEFLKGDYRNKMQLPDPEVYHIKRISNDFLNLL